MMSSGRERTDLTQELTGLFGALMLNSGAVLVINIRFSYERLIYEDYQKRPRIPGYLHHVIYHDCPKVALPGK
jgi:hypothetical protein